MKGRGCDDGHVTSNSVPCVPSGYGLVRRFGRKTRGSSFEKKNNKYARRKIACRLTAVRSEISHPQPDDQKFKISVRTRPRISYATHLHRGLYRVSGRRFVVIHNTRAEQCRACPLLTKSRVWVIVGIPHRTFSRSKTYLGLWRNVCAESLENDLRLGRQSQRRTVVLREVCSVEIVRDVRTYRRYATSGFQTKEFSRSFRAFSVFHSI